MVDNEKKPAGAQGSAPRRRYVHRSANKMLDSAAANTTNVVKPAQPAQTEQKPVQKPVQRQPQRQPQKQNPPRQAAKQAANTNGAQNVQSQRKPAENAVQKTEGVTAQKTAAPRKPRRQYGPKQPLAGAVGQQVTTYSQNGTMRDDERSKNTPTFSSHKLKVIPLGGLNEIGKNMTVLEYGDDIMVVDCGMTFPDDELLGVDLVICDITYLIKNKDRVRGIVLTHAHEDHIGGLPYALRELHVPIYCTALTEGIISLRIAEHRNLGKVKIHRKKAGDKFRLGVFEVEMVRVNHSVPDAVSLAIKTPVGMVVFTGDFKIDTTPVDGQMADLERFGRLGREGVLLLCQDSTNAERPGFATSERNVGIAFDNQFKGSEGKRIIVASFASNVHRIQQIIDISLKYGRKIAVSGRSMENIIKVGTELGYIKIPPESLVDLTLIRRYPKDKMVIITTGSQGEPMSALYRMAFSGHKQVEIGPDDKILIAAQPIPGNEKSVYQMINELMRKGAEVVYERLADIHVSGHACQEELKMMIALMRPKYFMPVHGEYRHLMVHANLAKQCGVKPENIFISDIGKVLEFSDKGAVYNGIVPSGRVLVDGYGVGDVGTAVLRDRKHLSQDGLIVAVVSLDAADGHVIAGPDIVSRGFVFMRDAEELTEDMRKVTLDAIETVTSRGVTDWATIKSEIKDKLSEYLYKKLKRNPMILPVIMEV